MGGIFKAAKSAVKGVTKGLTKAVKSTVKRVKKVGKSVMKGVAKISNKLGPIGMIALSIAMPYALAGLSSMTTAAMGSTNGFLQAIGNVGGAIRTGYNAFNMTVSNAFSSISNSISEGFSRFAPKGNNIFSRISEGAKTLYTSAKETIAKYTPKPFTGKEGTVEFFDDDGIQLLKSSDAANLIEKNALDVSRLGEQTLSSQGGFFTKANPLGVESDKIIQDTINNAYKERLKGFSPDAERMFKDYRAKAIAEKTYLNDEQIGSFIENNAATTQNRFYGGKDKLFVDTDVDLLRTGDYEALNEAGTEFQFTGKEGFKNPAFKTSNSLAKQTTDTIKKSARGLAGSLLAPKPTAIAQTPDQIPYGDYSDGTQLVQAGYGGTDIQGSSGGSLLVGVFSEANRNKIMTHSKNMNLLRSIG